MTTKTTTKNTSKAETKPAEKTTARVIATKTDGKKDIQKLQRAIVDGLEDVKAQEIVVFDTEHLSSLFERVIVASGTSNRQTKALASSVVDAVREAGFGKPRVEGEANGEWIIVDCGAAVVHVMQPTFRSYYNLEELWGDKPVRLKLGAAKPAMAAEIKTAPTVRESEKPGTGLRRSSAAKKGVEEAFPSKAQLKKASDAKAAAAKKIAAKSAPKRAIGQFEAEKPVKPRVKTLVVHAPVKPAGKKVAARNTAARPTAKTARKTAAASTAAKKPAPRKA
jgi:ribosome-associated protein